MFLINAVLFQETKLLVLYKEFLLLLNIIVIIINIGRRNINKGCYGHVYTICYICELIKRAYHSLVFTLSHLFIFNVLYYICNMHINIQITLEPVASMELGWLKFIPFFILIRFNMLLSSISVYINNNKIKISNLYMNIFYIIYDI